MTTKLNPSWPVIKRLAMAMLEREKRTCQFDYNIDWVSNEHTSTHNTTQKLTTCITSSLEPHEDERKKIMRIFLNPSDDDDAMMMTVRTIMAVMINIHC